MDFLLYLQIKTFLDMIFEKNDIQLVPDNTRCHTGGAEGADTVFEIESMKRGCKVLAYSYKTTYHKSPNKVEISELDYQEGIQKIIEANKTLSRWGIKKYMNLLARNWSQVKWSDQIIAIGTIINPGEKNLKGYKSAAKIQTIDGGTGYACQMAIDAGKSLFVFDQLKRKWFRWSYTVECFVECSCPGIQAQNFAGIGTRQINESGVAAIKEVFELTFCV